MRRPITLRHFLSEPGVSTPTVAAAAAVFVDSFPQSFAAMADVPGLIYANLLVMGDRNITGAGNRLDSGFDNRWGAGRPAASPLRL